MNYKSLDSSKTLSVPSHTYNAPFNLTLTIIPTALFTLLFSCCCISCFIDNYTNKTRTMTKNRGGGSNPDYARDRPNFACQAWARMGKNGQKCFFPERSFLNSLKCVWLPFNDTTSYLGCSFMS